MQLRIFSFGPNEGITLVPILVAWRIKSMYQTVTRPVCNQLTGLTGGGKLTIHNAPNTAPLEILKTSDDGKVSGISFLVEQRIPGSGYQPLGTYTTDGSGRILIPNLSVGVSFRVAETVPQNYTAEKKTQVIMHPRTLKEEPFKAKPPHEPATKCAVLQLIHVGLCVGVCWETHSATWIRCTMHKRTKREI